MSLLSVRNLNTGYGKKQVLFNVSIDLYKNDTILLIGPNGSGKSTLLKSIYRLIPYWNMVYSKSDLQIEFNRINLLKKKSFELIKEGILYIPQKNQIFGGLTVIQNLEAALLHNNNANVDEKIDHVFELLPLLFSKRDQDSKLLSGGEKKILSLALAIINQPKLLLLDEPSAGLSAEKIPLILNILEKLRQSGTTLLIVEHRIKEFFDFANRVVGMKQGVVSTQGIKTINNAKNFML